MRRRLLIALLAFGTLAGYSSGFASLYRWHRYGHASYGRSCHHGQGSTSNTASWASSRAPRAQAQAPAGEAPAEPGPR